MKETKNKHLASAYKSNESKYILWSNTNSMHDAVGIPKTTERLLCDCVYTVA